MKHYRITIDVTYDIDKPLTDHEMHALKLAVVSCIDTGMCDGEDFEDEPCIDTCDVKVEFVA